MLCVISMYFIITGKNPKNSITSLQLPPRGPTHHTYCPTSTNRSVFPIPNNRLLPITTWRCLFQNALDLKASHIPNPQQPPHPYHHLMTPVPKCSWSSKLLIFPILHNCLLPTTTLWRPSKMLLVSKLLIFSIPNNCLLSTTTWWRPFQNALDHQSFSYSQSPTTTASLPPPDDVCSKMLLIIKASNLQEEISSVPLFFTMHTWNIPL